MNDALSDNKMINNILEILGIKHRVHDIFIYSKYIPKFIYLDLLYIIEMKKDIKPKKKYKSTDIELRMLRYKAKGLGLHTDRNLDIIEEYKIPYILGCIVTRMDNYENIYENE